MWSVFNRLRREIQPLHEDCEGRFLTFWRGFPQRSWGQRASCTRAKSSSVRAFISRS
jgi:hypothetical protein